MRALTTCGCVYRDGFRVLRHAGGAYPWRGACRLRGLETSFGGRERAASVLFLFWRRSSGECTVPNQGWMLAASPSTRWTRHMGTRFSTADRISGLPTVGRRHFPSLPFRRLRAGICKVDGCRDSTNRKSSVYSGRDDIDWFCSTSSSFSSSSFSAWCVYWVSGQGPLRYLSTCLVLAVAFSYNL